MDGFTHPNPKIPLLSLVVSILWPGFGIVVNSCYAANGLDIKTLVLGLFTQWLFWMCCFTYYFIIPFFLALLIWAFGLYFGYLVYKKSTWWAIYKIVKLSLLKTIYNLIQSIHVYFYPFASVNFTFKIIPDLRRYFFRRLSFLNCSSLFY